MDCATAVSSHHSRCIVPLSARAAKWLRFPPAENAFSQTTARAESAVERPAVSTHPGKRTTMLRV